MSKNLIAALLVLVLVMGCAGCGKAPAPESRPTAPAETRAASAEPAAPAETPAAPEETSAASPEPGRRDGECFEAVIILEGMEETVHYEHIRNEGLGFEMDYDYENFVRHREADREFTVVYNQKGSVTPEVLAALYEQASEG